MATYLKSKTDYSNIPKSIEDKLGRKLHNLKNHPIEIIKRQVYKYFAGLAGYNFAMFDDLDPVVSVEANFDNLLIPVEHSARSKSDTYYVNEHQVLRTHTSAHQNELLSAGHRSFLATGDVYRKDEVDARHYPVFHQMEMLTLVEDNLDPEQELKKILSGLIDYLFPGCEYRFNPDYFPFTSPSFEIEVKYNGNWLEILGCGVVQPKILENNGLTGKRAIAAGFGLDRLVMIFCNIHDIRYLWSTHDRFISQFTDGKLVEFQQYSELPALTKDISFYIPAAKLEIRPDGITQIKWLEENDFYELVRECAGDMMEEVKLLDTFYNPKTNKYSRTYRFTYSPNDPGLKNGGEFLAAVNTAQDAFRSLVESNILVELR
jgi:phenylalanyl-tRNA synthetase alpha chain